MTEPTSEQRKIAEHLGLHPDHLKGLWPFELINMIIDVEKFATPAQFYELMFRINQRMSAVERSCYARERIKAGHWKTTATNI